MKKQNFYWLIAFLLGVLLIDLYFQVKTSGWHFYESKWFMWRVLFIAILIFFVLLQQLQTAYKKEKYLAYYIIKEFYRDKFILATENQNFQIPSSKIFSLDVNIPFYQRLSNFISNLEKETNLSISFQGDSEINPPLFLQFLISEIIKVCLSLLPLTKFTGVNITVKKTVNEYTNLTFVSSSNNTLKINNNYNLLKQIVCAFNGKYKTRKYKEKFEIEILLPVISN